MTVTPWTSTEDTCPTCCRPAGAPFRQYEGSKVVNGCVDGFHTGHLVTPSNSAGWHSRSEAKKIRKAAEFGRKHGYSKAVK